MPETSTLSAGSCESVSSFLLGLLATRLTSFLAPSYPLSISWGGEKKDKRGGGGGGGEAREDNKSSKKESKDLRTKKKTKMEEARESADEASTWEDDTE